MLRELALAVECPLVLLAARRGLAQFARSSTRLQRSRATLVAFRATGNDDCRVLCSHCVMSNETSKSNYIQIAWLDCYLQFIDNQSAFSRAMAPFVTCSFPV